MNITDEQLALELDAFLTARLNGRPLPPVSEALANDVQLAGELLNLAAQMEPETRFLSTLEAGLAAQWTDPAAPAEIKKIRPERPSFWQNIISVVKEPFTMKRTLFALGMTLALFVFGFFAWSALNSGQEVEPGVIANARPTETTPDNPETLPTLPSLSGASGLGGGFGGGGGGGDGVESAAAESSIRFANPLSGTTYILNTTLPLEPTGAVVYNNAAAPHYTIEDALRLAERFGFSGPAYTEHYYMEPGNEWTPTLVYQFYDGNRQLAVGSTYFSYFDNYNSPKAVYEPLDFAQSGPIAEAFLQERSLLDFPYEMISQNGFDVEFRRLVDGRASIFPELQVSVNHDGQVTSVFGNRLGELTALGNYPLRTAEEALQMLQEQGVDFSQVFYSTMPGPDFVMPEPPVGYDEYHYWQRQFSEGQNVTMYSYPMVFLPHRADGSPVEVGATDLAPRIVVDWYTVTGSAEQLWALSEYVGRQVRLDAVYHEVGNELTLTINSWEALENPVEYTFREGMVSQNGRQTLLVVSDSESFIIPDAPADLADGEKIYISGWIDAPVGSTTPSIFNWQGMGVIIDEPITSEPDGPQIDIMPVDSFVYRIGEVTIDQVELVYAVISIYDEATQSVSYTFSPVWRFSGTTDTQELISIYVQAIPDELVTPQEPVG